MATLRTKLFWLLHITQKQNIHKLLSTKAYSTHHLNTMKLASTQLLNITQRSQLLNSHNNQFQTIRSYGARKSFIGQFLENITQEFKKDKSIEENVKKFREKKHELENTEAMKKVRKNFEELESSNNLNQIKSQFEDLKSNLKSGIDVAQNSEFAKSAQMAAEAIAKQGQQIGQLKTIKAVSQIVEKEIKENEAALGARIYRAPAKLQKRSDRTFQTASTKTYEPNEKESEVVLHKDSSWFERWQKLKDNNPYVNGLFDLKTKYDESDNPILRASKAITTTISDLFGNILETTEMSKVLTEIIKIDPSFDKETFLKECEAEIIPNILESYVQGNLEVLRDWCHEAPYNILADQLKKIKELGYTQEAKILDISNIELLSGHIMEEHGPALVIKFNAQQVVCIKDSKNLVVEGSPDKVERVVYVFCLCRDITELNPKLAWKLIEILVIPQNM